MLYYIGIWNEAFNSFARVCLQKSEFKPHHLSLATLVGLCATFWKEEGTVPNMMEHTATNVQMIR